MGNNIAIMAPRQLPTDVLLCMGHHGLRQQALEQTPAVAGASTTRAAAITRIQFYLEDDVSSAGCQVAWKLAKWILLKVILIMSSGGMDTAPRTRK